MQEADRKSDVGSIRGRRAVRRAPVTGCLLLADPRPEHASNLAVAFKQSGDLSSALSAASQRRSGLTVLFTALPFSGNVAGRLNLSFAAKVSSGGNWKRS